MQPPAPLVPRIEFVFVSSGLNLAAATLLVLLCTFLSALMIIGRSLTRHQRLQATREHLSRTGAKFARRDAR
jgi:hypothetical protein